VARDHGRRFDRRFDGGRAPRPKKALESPEDEDDKAKNRLWQTRRQIKNQGAANKAWQGTGGWQGVADALDKPLADLVVVDEPSCDGRIADLADLDQTLSRRASLLDHLDALAAQGKLVGVNVQRTAREGVIDGDEGIRRQYSDQKASDLRKTGEVRTFALFLPTDFQDCQDIERQTQYLIKTKLENRKCDLLWTVAGAGGGGKEEDDRAVYLVTVTVRFKAAPAAA